MSPTTPTVPSPVVPGNRRHSWPTRFAIVVAGAAMVVGCTSGDEEAGQVPDTSISGDDTSAGEPTAVAFESPGADDFNKLLESTDGLVDPQPVDILNVASGTEADGATTSLIVSFEMGSHHCRGVVSDVVETDAEIIVGLEVGGLPGIEPAACTDGVYPYTTEIELSEPLGDRAITPAEPREPEVAADPTAEADSSGGGGSDVAGDPPSDDGAGQTDGPGPDGGEGEVGGGDDADGTEEPPPGPERGEAPAGAAIVVGLHVEDGVEWALARGIEWRVLSFDGVPFAEDSPDNPDRISFVVERDVIVSYEWS